MVTPGSAQTVIAADDADTLYTFTDDGRIRSKTDPDGVTTTFYYDVFGNVTHIHIAGSTLFTDTYATFDAQGRQTSYTDELGNKTTYSFSSGSSGTTETVAFKADGDSSATTIETNVTDLDGSPYSDSGSSVATPSTDDEGVVTDDTTINGITVPAGSTWTKTNSDGSGNYTQTYYNLLGEQIAEVQTVDYAGTEASTESYDDNGRVIQEVDLDGTITNYEYDPATGELAATWSTTMPTASLTKGSTAARRAILPLPPPTMRRTPETAARTTATTAWNRTSPAR